jgi:signal peptidase I
MSDDWSGYRGGAGGEGEKDDTELGSDDPGGWPQEESSAGESQGGWPEPGPTWQRPGFGEEPRDWERSESGDSGYTRGDELLFGEEQSEHDEAQHTRDPLARLFPSLPHSVRVTLDWILTIAGAILIVLALKAWVVNPYRIPSSSMEPTLNCAKGPLNQGCLGDSSDRVLACRICLDFGRNPSRGDIVVFNTPSAAAQKCGEGGTFVKRVIGLPGDTIYEDDKGFISIKSPGSRRFVKLNEPYISAQDRLADRTHFGQYWPTVHGRPTPLGPGQYFMMGDNRSESCDSRTWGSVPRNKLIGTVFFVYWPPDRISFK